MLLIDPMCTSNSHGNRKPLLTYWGQDKMAATLADDTFKYKYVNENF